jgi:two-component system response regulator DesR
VTTPAADLPATGPDRKLRVLVVDDHDVVHWGFRLMLSQQPWVERCLSARNAEEAVAHAVRYEPHVALVDLFIGDESGAEICEQVRERSPRTRVLFISGAGRLSEPAARAAGASGFVPKEWPADEIARAVRTVARGRTVFGDEDERPANRLSEREREVLALMASGSTNREIADELHLSHWTVKEYAAALYRKLEVRNRAEAVQRGQRLGLLS